MARGKARPWPTAERLLELAEQHHGVITEIAVSVGREIPDGLPVTSQAVTTVLRREGILDRVREIRAERGPSTGAEDVVPGSRTITSDDPAKLGTLRELLEENGVDPDDWIPLRGVFNRWGDPANYNRQVKVTVVPRIGLLTPVRVSGWTPPDRAKYAGQVDETLSPIFGDDHCPWHDPAFAAAGVEWLRQFKPAKAFHLGDLFNYERLSVHPATPRFNADLKTTNQVGYDLMRARVDASPGTEWHMTPGNHDDYIRRAILKFLPALHGLPRVKAHPEHPDEAPVLSLPFLLRLDELGVRFPTQDDDWARHEVDIAPGVIGVHAGATRSKSGQSALAAIQAAGISTFMGHIHRQGIVWMRQKRRPMFFGCEIGTGSQLDLGYGKPDPDWHPGFATCSVTPDGFAKPELAYWTGERLVWRDWDFKP